MNDNNTISVFTNQNTYDGKGNGNTEIIYPNAATQSQLFYNESDNISSQYNLAYKHKFKKEGETLDF